MSLKRILRLKGTLLLRLTLWYAGIFTLSSLLIFSILYYKIQAVAVEEIRADILDDVSMYSGLMARGGLKEVLTELVDEAVNEDPEEEFSRLLDLDGRVIFSTEMSAWGEPDSYAIPESLRQGSEKRVMQVLSVPGREGGAHMVSALIGSGAVLQLGETMEDSGEYLLLIRDWFLAALGVIMLLSGVIGWVLAKRALGDMEEVTRTASEISQGTYDKRVRVRRRFKEIERLGGTFNRMLDRIDDLMRSLREVNDNIAHDLRSPLARIRGIAEMSLLNDKTAEEYRNFAVSTIEECDNLINMINTMLEINEIDSGVNDSHPETVDLTPLIRDAYELFLPLAEQKKVGITLDLPEKLPVTTERRKLQRVVSNLLDNAIKYTDEGGSVRIAAASDGKDVRIILEDTGIGISEADLPHIFERFYRCDRSRSQGGGGLGLSLARALTRSMQGSIEAESTPGRGSRFTVILPQTISVIPE